MSFDIHFVPVGRGESFDDAVERWFVAAEQDPLSPAPEERATWQRVIARSREVLPTLELFEQPDSVQLIDEDSGLDITLAPGPHSSISIAYWHEGAEALDLLRRVAEVARVIESETGLVAYDPQEGERFFSEGADPDRVAERVAQRMDEVRTTLDGLAGGATKRWWQFWRRG